MQLARLVLGAALAIAAPVAANAGRVDLPLRIGSSETASVDRPGGVSTAAFLVHEGQKRKLTIAVKRAKRSSLLPEVIVYGPDGNVVDFNALGGKVKSNSKSFKAVLNDVPTTGVWRVEVRGADDSTGEFQLSVDANDAASTKGSTVVLLGGSASVPITAGDGYALTVAVKRSKGSSIVPDVEVIDPNGNVIARSVGAAKQSAKKGTAKLRKLELPTFGQHVVRFVGDQGTGGGVAYSIKTTRSKYKGTRAIADAGPTIAAEPSITATLDATASVPSVPGRLLESVWTQVGGPDVELSDVSSARPTFLAPEAPTSLAFHLAVLENGLPSEPRLVIVDVAARPIADPGRARVAAPSSLVTLDADASFDRAARGLTHVWRVIDGDVVLDDPTSATPSFTAPATDTVVRVGLVVDDGIATSFEATQIIHVTSDATVVADAGREQYVGRMATVFLSGIASRRPSGVLDSGASWTQLSGPTVELAGADTFFPNFTAPRQPADLLFELTVDGVTETTQRTWVRVRPDGPNAAPTTIVNGPLGTLTGSVSLDASNSFDTDGDSVRTRWASLSGSGATLSHADAATPTVTGLDDASGLWLFVAQTRDELQYGAPDLVRVIGTAFDSAPLAVAGPNRTASASSTIGLDGSTSTRSGVNPLSFAWRQVSGTDWYDVAAEFATFDPSAARPQFRLPADLSSLTSRRSVTFELVVSDENGTSAPDFVTVTFTGLPFNAPPVMTATAAETNPLAGAIVRLSGTGSDRDGDDVAPTWTQVSGPIVNLTPSRNVLSPSFPAPAAGTLVFDLNGSDGFTTSAPARVTIVVDQKPVAIATADPPDGPAATVVTIDGSASTDPDGGELTFSWTQIGGSAVSFDATAESFQVTSPASGMTFRLVVSDGRQDSDPVQVAFADESAPTPAPTSDVASAAYTATVQLRANPSDSDPATFSWRQINPGGVDPVVTLSSQSAQDPTFTVPAPTSAAFGGSPSATFGVTATRSGKSSEEKTVSVQFFASYNDSSLSSQNRVYGIISQSCTGCHRGSNSSCPVGSGGTATGYGMATANAFSSNSIGQNACRSSKSRVQASNSAQSYLMDRLNGTGGSMPPSGVLSAAKRNLIKDWIDQGASTSR